MSTPSTDLAIRLADEATTARTADELTGIASALKENIVANVRAQWLETRDRHRPDRVTGAADVAAEVHAVARLYDALSELAAAFKAGADEAKAIGQDLVFEVSGKESGTASLEVGAVDGSLKISVTQPSKVSAKTDKIAGIVANAIVIQYGGDDETNAALRVGALRGIEALLDLISPPAWKTTALDALGRRLEAAGEYGIAIELGHSYGRVDSGRPAVKFDRKTA